MRGWFLGALLVAVALTGCIEDTPATGGDSVCPQDPTAQAEPGGDVSLAWSPVTGAEAYPIVRSGPGSSDVLIANVSASNTTFVDPNASRGGTYYYTIHAWNGSARSTDCPALEVTTVAFLPGGATLAWAGVLASGVYFAYRVRR